MQQHPERQLIVVYVLKSPHRNNSARNVHLGTLDIVKQCRISNTTKTISEEIVGQVKLTCDKVQIGTLQSDIPVQSEEFICMISHIMPSIRALTRSEQADN